MEPKDHKVTQTMRNWVKWKSMRRTLEVESLILSWFRFDKYAELALGDFIAADAGKGGKSQASAPEANQITSDDDPKDQSKWVKGVLLSKSKVKYTRRAGTMHLSGAFCLQCLPDF